MTAAMRLTKATVAGLVALAVCSLALAYVTSSLDSYQSVNAAGLSASGMVMLRAGMYIGAAVIVLFGAPAFTILSTRSVATWPRTLALGATPSVLTAPFSWPLALLFLPFGLLVSAFVRLVCGPGPNNSSKPTPLRGAA